MKLEIPGQLRGGDAGKVMPVAIEIRRELEPEFAALGDAVLTRISPILRVGGNAGTFGEDGIELVKILNKEAACDVVVDVRSWNDMRSDDIRGIIRPRLIEALRVLLDAAGSAESPDCLH